MDVRGFDLNLLAMLDVLVQEKSVTRAGKKLGLSQPAMSYNLSRIRAVLGDEILVRTSKGMVPTPRALAIAGAVRRTLDELGGVLEAESEFDPAKADRTFRIALTDHSAFVLVPELTRRLSASAPNVNLEMLPWRGDETWREVESGGLDLAIGVGDLARIPAGLYQKSLFQDRFVCLARAGHPRIKKRLTLEAFVAVPHVLVSPRGGRTGLVDDALRQMDKKRRVAVVVPHFLVAPFIVASTDLIATLSAFVARPFTELLDVRTFPAPIEITGGHWFSVWHERTHKDRGHRWLREQLISLGREVEIAAQRCAILPHP